MRMHTLDSILDRLQPVTESGCMIYEGCIDKSGYSKINYNKKSYMLHRIVYELQVGPIPEGFEIDHLCKVRCCANINHLEAVSPRINSLRSGSYAAANAKKLKCKCGTDYKKVPPHKRVCIPCKKKYEQSRWLRKRDILAKLKAMKVRS